MDTFLCTIAAQLPFCIGMFWTNEDVPASGCIRFRTAAEVDAVGFEFLLCFSLINFSMGVVEATTVDIFLTGNLRLVRVEVGMEVDTFCLAIVTKLNFATGKFWTNEPLHVSGNEFRF